MRHSIVWALSKRCDLALLPFFRDCLKRDLETQPEGIFQDLIALDNLREPVFSPSRGGSYSLLDVELNRADAVAYLGKQAAAES